MQQLTTAEDKISQIPVDIELRPFHEDFKNASLKDLPQLKENYPLLLPSQVPDSIWEVKLSGNDTIQNILEEALTEKNVDLSKIELDFENLFRHIKYYFPEFKPVDVYTVISEVDYRNKVIPKEFGVAVALDAYLGADHELYLGMDNYLRSELKEDQMMADAALAYAKLFVQPTQDRSFLGQLVFHGKLHYLQSLFVPADSPELWFNFPKEKYEFTVQNENQIWRYFIDKDLLYSTNRNLETRFLARAPFSKFYLEIDTKTPGGVGRFIGYRIVSSFMKNNDITVNELLELPTDIIFNESKYKPSK